MKILKRCIAAAAAVAVCGAQLFCPEFIVNDNIIITYALESRISDSGIELIKEFEGFVQYAEWDYNQWSIGYGTGVEKDAYPDGITEEEADLLLRKAVLQAEDSVQKFLTGNGIRVTQNQYDVLVSFTYNLGNVWAYESEVTIRTYLLNGISNYSPQQIKDAFGLWVKAGGEVSPGLVKRRAREAEIFLSDGSYMPDTAVFERWRITSATGVRLRSEPDVSSESFGILPYGTVLTVSEKKNGGGFLWGKVTAGDSKGWCVLDYAEHMTGDISSDPVPEENRKAEKWRITSDNGVNLRYSFSTDSTVIDIIPYNAVIPVYETRSDGGYTWALTEYNGNEGWCVLEYASKIITDQYGNPVLLSIRTDRLPDRKEYIAGEKFDSAGMKVTAVYSDGTEKEVFDYGCSVNTSVPGTFTVKIDYQGKSASFSIKVTPQCGDINADGAVDTGDEYALRYYLLKGDPGISLKTSWDINGDGSIDVMDGILVRKKILNNYSKEN